MKSTHRHSGSPPRSGASQAGLGRLRVPFGGQVFTLGPQRPFPFTSTVFFEVEAGAFGLDRGAGGADRLVGRFVQADERAVVLAGQRLGIDDQRAEGGVGRPGDLADQVTGLIVAGPGPPGLGQCDGRSVPLGGPFPGRAGVLVSGGPQVFCFCLRAQDLLLRVGEPAGF